MKTKEVFILDPFRRAEDLNRDLFVRALGSPVMMWWVGVGGGRGSGCEKGLCVWACVLLSPSQPPSCVRRVRRRVQATGTRRGWWEVEALCGASCLLA
jgi:hypothetical protein